MPVSRFAPDADPDAISELAVHGLGGPVSLVNFVQDGTCLKHIILRRTRSVSMREFRCLCRPVVMYHDALGSVWTSAEDYASKFCGIFFWNRPNNRLQLNIMWGSTWLELT